MACSKAYFIPLLFMVTLASGLQCFQGKYPIIQNAQCPNTAIGCMTTGTGLFSCWQNANDCEARKNCSGMEECCCSNGECNRPDGMPGIICYQGETPSVLAKPCKQDEWSCTKTYTGNKAKFSCEKAGACLDGTRGSPQQCASDNEPCCCHQHNCNKPMTRMSCYQQIDSKPPARYPIACPKTYQGCYISGEGQDFKCLLHSSLCTLEHKDSCESGARCCCYEPGCNIPLQYRSNLTTESSTSGNQQEISSTSTGKLSKTDANNATDTTNETKLNNTTTMNGTSNGTTSTSTAATSSLLNNETNANNQTENKTTVINNKNDKQKDKEQDDATTKMTSKMTTDHGTMAKTMIETSTTPFSCPTVQPCDCSKQGSITKSAFNILLFMFVLPLLYGDRNLLI